MNKKVIPALALAAAAAAVPAVSHAETSANFGWVSEYIFRGNFQKESSAFAGLDYSSGGFYLGTWGADVGDGLETDLYVGYGGGEDFTWTIGYTGYFYTDDFDDTYQEVNLGVGYGIFALDVALGEWDGFGAPADYTFTSLTLSPETGPYFKYGTWGEDFDGDYLEIGYAFDFMEVELSIAYIHSKDVAFTSHGTDGDDNSLIFGISKTLALGVE